jgi:superfamily II DNA or RNA helicase
MPDPESTTATRSSVRRGGDLFIVDNSVEGWSGIRYLREWCDLAKSFDIATGFFEIGSLLALDGKWQGLEKIRILMGGDVTSSTRKALLDMVRDRATQHLDASLEGDKDANPFLRGVPAILDALNSRQIEVKVYNREKFHAKAYITHAKLEVIGAQALVGSSNFTRPGLTQNVELNIQVQSGREVEQLQIWFDQHWKIAEPVTDDVIRVVERHIQEFTPFEVYAKALFEYFRGHEVTASEWENSQSHMFPVLDRYQQEGYGALMKIAHQHAGAFLCDGVGLGKTFVGLMLIERLVLHEGKRVVLFAPKGAREAVWEPHLRRWLPHIGGVSGGADFSNLAVFSHTDLDRGGSYPERFRRMTELADVVIVDEAHHFRNPGNPGRKPDGGDRSRYYRLYDLLDGSVRPKTLYLLTATPINNRLADFRHMAELFTRKNEAYFARTLGINNLRSHFATLEKSLRTVVGEPEGRPIDDDMIEGQNILARDDTFRHLVVQRSRAYVKASQETQGVAKTAFPTRSAPKVADYSIKKSYGGLLTMIEKAFAKKAPLFTLPIYYPLAYYRGDDTTITSLDENRQKEVVALIRTQFLKRFESSVCAFELSCTRLMRKLLAFLEVHSETDSERHRLERWRQQNAEVLKGAASRQLLLWDESPDADPDADEDIVPQEFLDAVVLLSRADYQVEEIMSETFLDLDQIVDFLEETRKFNPKDDDKLNKLVRLLQGKELADRKVLVFTEFADTARYIARQLRDAGIEGVEQVDSLTKGNRADIIQRFAPYYNDRTSPELAASKKKEIRVLVSTDVLSEGLNLQDATTMINYDIHWNPVRLMQRIGRVDRRMDPAIEAIMVADHPELLDQRGKVAYWNFLPPAELNAILSLYSTVTHKTLLISKTMGIEGRKLLTPDDDYEALKEFNETYEGTQTVIEGMHLELQALLAEEPELNGFLAQLPNGIFSGRTRASAGLRGVFFCYALPALDSVEGDFTYAAGTTRWYLYDTGRDQVIEGAPDILDSIRSDRKIPRDCIADDPALKGARARVLKHIKDTYLKRLDVPLDAPKPSLRCWMELHD